MHLYECVYFYWSNLTINICLYEDFIHGYDALYLLLKNVENTKGVSCPDSGGFRERDEK